VFSRPILFMVNIYNANWTTAQSFSCKFIIYCKQNHVVFFFPPPQFCLSLVLHGRDIPCQSPAVVGEHSPVPFPLIFLLHWRNVLMEMFSAVWLSLHLCFIEWNSTSKYVFYASIKHFYLVIFLFHKYLELNRPSTLKMDTIVCDSLWVVLLVISPSFSITPEAVGFKITLMVTLLNWING